MYDGGRTCFDINKIAFPADFDLEAAKRKGRSNRTGLEEMIFYA